LKFNKILSLLNKAGKELHLSLNLMIH